MPRLFVYGTLKKGFRNHHFLKGARLLSDEAEMEGFLLHLGGYPGMIDGHGIVHGELYEITEDMLPALDRLEGVPVLFQRNWIEGAYVYFYQPMMELRDYDFIESGRWT